MNLTSLSEQNLVDCGKQGIGCGGGNIWDAFESMMRLGGINDEQSYPYEGRMNPQCRFNESNVVMSISETPLVIPSIDEEVLKRLVTAYGPVAVAIDGDNNEFKFYKSGIFHNSPQYDPSEGINHAVLVVGYGEDPECGDYWIIVSTCANTPLLSRYHN